MTTETLSSSPGNPEHEQGSEQALFSIELTVQPATAVRYFRTNTVDASN
ncbi:hypothetical protein [Streptomyces indicus]|nr:hypothetical protein [Streptomyces indicus]